MTRIGRSMQTLEAALSARFAPKRLVACLLPVGLAIAIGLLQGRARPLADDWEVIVNLDRLGFVRALLEDTGPSNMRFRPVAYGELWLERAMLGLSFQSVRWIGLTLLGVTGALVGALCSCLGLSRWRSAGAGALFVALPIHTEAYGWACTRVDTLAAALGLAGVIAALRARPAACFLLLLFAYLTKESTYPLAVICWVLLLGSGRASRAHLIAGTAASFAFLLALAAKAWVVGGLMADEWAGHIAWTARLRGYLSQIAILVRPMSSAAQAWARPIGWLLGLALLLGVVDRARASRRSGDPSSGRSGGGVLLTAALLLGFLLCLAVTGGLPARADLAGSRLWLLPSAFVVAAVCRWISTRSIPLLVVLGVALLHANLAPYREASNRMDAVLEVLGQEVPRWDRAVRVADLPPVYGPVPLFELMTTFYMLRFDGSAPEDRPLLTLRPRTTAEAEQQAAIDRRWRAWMKAQGRPILTLEWEDREGRLHLDPTDFQDR